MAALLPAQYGKILYELTKGLKKSELGDAIRVFIDQLYRDGALGKIDYIVDAFVAYAKKQDGVVTLDVTTAHTVSDALVQKIAKQFGKKVDVRTHVDESLIGGVMVRADNTILDGSVRTQIAQMKSAMLNT